CWYRSSHGNQNWNAARTFHRAAGCGLVGDDGAPDDGRRSTTEVRRPGLHRYADPTRIEVARPRSGPAASAGGYSGDDAGGAAFGRAGAVRWQGSLQVGAERERPGPGKDNGCQVEGAE